MKNLEKEKEDLNYKLFNENFENKRKRKRLEDDEDFILSENINNKKLKKIQNIDGKYFIFLKIIF
jgi:hypothetical protein